MNIETPSQNASSARRGYSSSLRDQQAEQTRETILKALSDLIRSGEMVELSYPLLAKRSGVSVPTLYRYFPSRKALFEAFFEWLGAALKVPKFPDTFEELLEKTPDLFEYYHQNMELLRTSRAANLLREESQEGRRQRDRGLVRILEPWTGHLSPEKANSLHALIRLIFSFDGYLLMEERFGTGPKEAAETAVWTARTLLERLNRDRTGTSAKSRMTKKENNLSKNGKKGKKSA